MTDLKVVTGFKSMFGKLKEMKAGRKLPKNFFEILNAQNATTEKRIAKFSRIVSEVGREGVAMDAEQIDSFQFPKKFSALALRRKLWLM